METERRGHFILFSHLKREEHHEKTTGQAVLKRKSGLLSCQVCQADAHLSPQVPVSSIATPAKRKTPL